MPQPASAMAKSPLQPTANGRAWRVVNADGSLTSFRDTRTMGDAGLEFQDGLPECEAKKPNAGMPASADELGDFVAEARKTGLYQRIGQIQEAEAPAVEAEVKKGPRLAELSPPHVESIAAACAIDVGPCVSEEAALPPFAPPQRPLDPQPPTAEGKPDPNLARVVDLWPELPLGIRAGILAMVEATIAERTYTRATC